MSRPPPFSGPILLRQGFCAKHGCTACRQSLRAYDNADLARVHQLNGAPEEGGYPITQYSVMDTNPLQCCGADSIPQDIDTVKGWAVVKYKCRALFTIENCEITVAGVCHAGTNLAAHLMNAETMGPRREATG